MTSSGTRRRRGDGALYFDAAKRRWVGRVVVAGRRHKVLAETKSEARRRLAELRSTVDRGLPVTPGDLTLADLLTMWESKALPNRVLSPSHLSSHRWAVRILTEELGRRRLRSLTPDQVEAAFQRRAAGSAVAGARREGRGRTAGAPLSRGSLIKLRSSLNQALTWAQRRDLIARNIAPLVEIPASAAPPKAGRSMTMEQAKLFLVASRGTAFEAMWFTMLYLGLRPGEAAAISWADVDFDNGVVHIWRSRKVDLAGAAVVGDTKTPGSIRSLDAPPVVLDSLAAHRSKQNRQRLAVGPVWSNVEGLVFTSPTGRPTDPHAIRDEFHRVVEASGIGDGWTPNLLRHSAASLMADAGMPIEQVADQLGHRDLRMLQKHYRHRLRPTVGGGHVLGEVLDLASSS